MTSGRRKKIVIAGVVLLCVAGLFAVAQIYASYTDRNERAYIPERMCWGK